MAFPQRGAALSVPAPVPVTGPWEVRFAAAGDARQATFGQLVPWNEHADPAIKYLSGTAAYRKTVAVPNDTLQGDDCRWELDLGAVPVMARVILNGRDVGVLWKTPLRVDVTDAVKAGDNVLEIEVVNLWPNRMIGDEQLPEDSDRYCNGTLKAWPDWLGKGEPSPAGRQTFTSWRMWKKDDALLPSGLLGPVTFRVIPQVPLSEAR